MPAHPVRRRAPRRAKPLRPLHNARYAHPKQRRRCPARATARHRCHNPISKVRRIGSRHPCWPPTPASILNQKSPTTGIPYLRFRPIESRSRCELSIPSFSAQDTSVRPCSKRQRRNGWIGFAARTRVAGIYSDRPRRDAACAAMGTYRAAMLAML
jgi:hypothetical protein